MRITLFLAIVLSINTQAQFNEDQLGSWYMYFWNTTLKEGSSVGFQGDIQHRNWNTIGDLEQLLIRGGFTYQPKDAPIKFTLGFANIQTGEFGESNDGKIEEQRVYQEALLPHKISNRFLLTHRFRYEQRMVENQDLRTRYRYNLFLNVPLTNKELIDKTIYLALYNELFINGERSIGDGRTVELFDRNRFYSALGYQIKKGLKTQLGIMKQTTNNWSKRQLQLSIHHQF